MAAGSGKLPQFGLDEWIYSDLVRLVMSDIAPSTLASRRSPPKAAHFPARRRLLREGAKVVPGNRYREPGAGQKLLAGREPECTR